MTSSNPRWWEKPAGWDQGRDPGWKQYSGNLYEVGEALKRGEIDEATAKELRKTIAEKTFTPSSFDMGEFEGLLGRLESSKMRQQRQKSVEGRRDIMAGGLAGMMSNF